MATKYEYYDSGDDAYLTIFAAHWWAQTFTPETSHTVTSVGLKVQHVGACGDGTISIRATDVVSGHPTGDDLCSGTISEASIPESPTASSWIEFSLGEGTALTATTKYAIVIRLAGGDDANYLRWRVDASDPTYAGGNGESSDNSGSSWADWDGDPNQSRDALFEEWSTGAFYPQTSAVGWGFSVSSSRLVGASRTGVSPSGLSATSSRAIAISRSASASLGVGLTVSRLRNVPRLASASLGFAVTASRVKATSRAANVALGKALTVSRAVVFLRTSGLSRGFASAVTVVRNVLRVASTSMGFALSVGRSCGHSITASTVMGFHSWVRPVTRMVRRVRRVGEFRHITRIGA